MTHRTRTAACLLALAGLLLACSGGDDDASGSNTSAPESTAGGGVSTVGDDDAVAAAEEFLDGWERLDEEGRASLGVTEVDPSLGVTHVHYGQSFRATGDDEPIPVRGAEVIVHIAADGSVLGANSAYTDARPIEGVELRVDEAEATDTAGKAAPAEVVETLSARVVWLPDGDALRLGWSVIQTTEDGGHQVWVDAVTGEVADTRRLRVEHQGGALRAGAPVQAGGGCELDDGDAPAACVFLPDPFFANGGDTPDVDETSELLSAQPLLGLDDPEGGRLVGEFANTEPPNNPIEPTVEDDGLWSQGRGEPGFEAAMTYYWIDRVQRQIQDLGFDDVRNESFPIIPVDPDVENNAFFDGAAEEIHMGIGPDDGINEGEDANGIVHEYGHAVLDAQVPSMIGQGGDAGAYHEGFGDLLAFLATLEHRAGDPPCLFIWTDQSCLRRVDGDKVYPDDLVNIVHDDGEIYTGAIFDVVGALLDADGLTVDDCPGSDDCTAVRDRVLTTLLASHEFLTGNELLPDIATAFVLANEAAFDGADAELIEAALAEHGLDGAGGAVLDGEGQPTGEPRDAEVRVDISHSFRGDLRIELHVVDAGFDDLCDPIVLLEPDPDDNAPDVRGGVDISASACAALVPPSPDQQWVLSVVDTLAEDTGVINAFQVLVQGEPFLATGVPATIADDDPTGTTLIVNGSRQDVPQEGTEDVGGPTGGGPAVELTVTHTFRGDLFLRAGVVDAAGEVLCSVPVLEPDPADGTDDVAGAVDMAVCAQFFPPSADQRWFLEVVDEAALDLGAVTTFAVLGADGSVVAAAGGLPLAIPDNDPAGIVVFIPSS